MSRVRIASASCAVICIAIAAIMLFTGEKQWLLNLTTGQTAARYTVCDMPLPMSVTDGTIARRMKRCGVNITGVDRWVVIRSKTVFNRISPHYAYHSAQWSLETMEQIGDEVRIADIERCAAVAEVIGLLRGGKVREAKMSCNRLCESWLKATDR